MTDPELATMQPDPAWDPAAHEATVEALADDSLAFLVWGGDWCADCRGQLPDFAAALEAAGVPPERVREFPVEKVDGEKRGPKMEEYGVAYVPTVIVERERPDGEREELARFVEDADVPVATYLARELRAADA